MKLGSRRGVESETDDEGMMGINEELEEEQLSRGGRTWGGQGG